MTIARHALVPFAVAALALTATQPAFAGLLIDRGLPTTNLNNAAGANRSNVSWAFAPDTSGTWVVGDTFANTSAFNYSIDTIRVWTTGSYDSGSLTLLGGLNGGSVGTISTSVVATPVQYTGGLDYQTTTGSMIPLTQLDFAVTGLTLAPGQVYDFFLQGTSGGGKNQYVFTHASNAALSGSPQVGADNLMLAGVVAGGSVTSISSWTSLGNGWDKASDINVQVFGTVPDAGSTVLLLGAALAGIGLLRRRLAA